MDIKVLELNRDEANPINPMIQQRISKNGTDRLVLDTDKESSIEVGGSDYLFKKQN